MKITTTVSHNVSSAIELGVASMRAILGQEPEIVPEEAPSRPNAAVNLAAGTAALDARLDAIRRAGL